MPRTAVKPHLLYLSPVVPLLGGNGLAMRAATVLRSLTEQYHVSLLVVRLYAPYAGPIPDEITSLCYRIVDRPPTSAPPSPPSVWARFAMLARRGLTRSIRTSTIPGVPFSDVPFHVLHVFRLAMVPFAQPYLHTPVRHLDLDDVESVAHGRLAGLYRLNGNPRRAQFEERAAQRAAALERAVLRAFNRVYVCSAGDLALLPLRGRAQRRVLPNALAVPTLLLPKDENGPFTFLFVGTLGYYPNEDALHHFCTAILPLLREAAERPFEIAIVGTGATAVARQLVALPNVRLVGEVPHVRPLYQQANAVIVPLRAGGGTRIKVLEAFSYRRAVVSTSLGIEGIAARAEEHVLLGDTPAAFAQHCLRLMSDPHLAERLTTNAHALFLREYTIEAVARTMRATE